MLGINTPNKVSAKDRGIPHVLKDVKNPLFKESIAEPLNESSIVIQEELRTEDLASVEVKSKQSVPVVPVKVVSTTETTPVTPKLDNDNVSSVHTMPSVDLSHKACGVDKCMSCAFNVMYAYFNSKHVSSDKTAPHQHVNNKKHVRSKTTSPPKARENSFVLKPNMKFVKAGYKLKSSVIRKLKWLRLRMLFCLIKVNSLSMLGPTKFGFRRRSNPFMITAHNIGEPCCVDFEQWMFKAYDRR